MHKQTYTHVLQRSPASVGLTQARPSHLQADLILYGTD